MLADNFCTYLILDLSEHFAEGRQPEFRAAVLQNSPRQPGGEISREDNRRVFPDPTAHCGASLHLGPRLHVCWKALGGRGARLGRAVPWSVHSSECLPTVLFKPLFNICLGERLSPAWEVQSRGGGGWPQPQFLLYPPGEFGPALSG